LKIDPQIYPYLQAAAIQSNEVLAEQLDPAVVCSYTREVRHGIRMSNSGTVSLGEVSADRYQEIRIPDSGTVSLGEVSANRHQGIRIPDSGTMSLSEVSADRHQGIRIPDSGTVSCSEVSVDRLIIQVDHVEPAADWQIDERESCTWNRTQASDAAFPVSIYTYTHVLYKCI
jgi:hypothetical protein